MHNCRLFHIFENGPNKIAWNNELILICICPKSRDPLYICIYMYVYLYTYISWVHFLRSCWEKPGLTQFKVYLFKQISKGGLLSVQCEGEIDPSSPPHCSENWILAQSLKKENHRLCKWLACLYGCAQKFNCLNGAKTTSTHTFLKIPG